MMDERRKLLEELKTTLDKASPGPWGRDCLYISDKTLWGLIAEVEEFWEMDRKYRKWLLAKARQAGIHAEKSRAQGKNEEAQVWSGRNDAYLQAVWGYDGFYEGYDMKV